MTWPFPPIALNPMLRVLGTAVQPEENAPGQPSKLYQNREQFLAEQERERRVSIGVRRMYYAGTQFERENDLFRLFALEHGENFGERAWARGLRNLTPLPEHLRKHEYATVLSKAIDFIAGRVSTGFAVEVEDSTAAAAVTACLSNSDELAGTEDDDDLTVLNIAIEALKAGDTPALVRWNPIKQECWLEFWDSEQVYIEWTDAQHDTVERVEVTETTWIPALEGTPQAGTMMQTPLIRVWQVESIVTNQSEIDQAAENAGEEEIYPVLKDECQERWYVPDSNNETGLRQINQIGWGVPFVPWWPVRGYRQDLRAPRGQSLIKDQAISAVDRLNSVLQHEFLAIRYNSHGNLVVTGDQAMLQSKQGERIEKDIADVLTFPGGTQATAISLPTDTPLISHQAAELLDQIYDSFGLARVDTSTVTGLGAVSGYALEILNDMTKVTFDRVQAQFVRDWKRLVNLVLDCHAIWSADTSQLPDTLYAEMPMSDVDPMQVFPNRTITITLGTGYVVDQASIRADFQAGLISREEALRRQGVDPDDIKQIVQEITDAQAATAQQTAEATRNAFGGMAVESGTSQPGAAPAADKTKQESGADQGRNTAPKAGSTVAS